MIGANKVAPNGISTQSFSQNYLHSLLIDTSLEYGDLSPF
jgi:hypothetical protein